MTKATIRKAQLHDAQAIVDFNQAMALETEDLQLDSTIITKGVSTLLAEPQRGFYLVAEVDGVLAGSLMVTFEWSDWRAKDYWWIQSVYIKPEFRRQGIYSKLYQEVKDQATANGGAASFRLYVEKDNQRAQSTYQALGMKPCQYDMYEQK
ncbi:GNAT family N-acetyltransferase [Paraferrimonas sp. SM1919]|uniref:GNAT family N-acetyltransferase n=1 Tax=Paraferrimonas sp. SM1919 TaxID=2662263 RepID=UPI0013D6978F|nr:GNAT family N-acetyltransferase [Paraferrimonas sp. SM1919]